MLTRFTVRGLALIRDATLELGPGLNVLTGEPGSGKSLLLTGLGLLMGGRGAPALVREGVDEASVEAEFELEEQGRLVVTRSLPRRGRGRAEAGGRSIGLAQLGELTRGLITLTAQHAAVGLGDPRAFLAALDPENDPLPARVRAAFDAVTSARAGLERERSLASRAEREGELLRRDLEELSALDPESLDTAKLRERLLALRASERIGACCARLADVLVERDGAIEQELRGLLAQVERLGELAALSATRDALEAALAAVNEAAAAAERVQRDLVAYPGELERLEERERALARLARRHACAPEALGGKVAELERELALLEGAVARAEVERVNLEAALEEAVRLSRELHRARVVRARELEQRLARELDAIGLAGARLTFELRERPPEALDARGLTDLSVLFAPNVGERPGELARIASGGERSRVLLALRCAGVAASAPTLVFDEVDAGLGGAALEALALRLSRAARGRQILCVTHHARVAAGADWHFGVRKFVASGRTDVAVERLDGERRVAELARMLAGGNEKGARPLARRLLSGAKPGREDAA